MFQVACIVGGMSEEKQQRVLRGSPEVVVGTPGRLWHLIEQVRIKVILPKSKHETAKPFPNRSIKKEIL